jgi:hypothetical protein
MPNTLSEKLRAKIAAAQQKMASGKKYFSLESGKPVKVRVIDGEYGTEGLFYRKEGTHYIGDKESCDCPKIINDGKCALCEHIEEMKEDIATLEQRIEDSKHNDTTPEELEAMNVELAVLQERVDNLYPVKKWRFNVLPRGETSIKMFKAPWSIFKEIFSAYASNVNEEGINILDPNSGYDFELLKEGSTKTTVKYSAVIQIAAKPLISTASGAPDTGAIEKLLSEKPNLDVEVEAPSYEDTVQAWNIFLNGPQDTKVPAKTAKAVETPKPSTTTNSTGSVSNNNAPMTPSESLAARLRNRK